MTRGEEDISEGTFTWASENETTGTVDSEGYFEGNRIGETTVTATGEGTFLEAVVTVEPYSTLYQEPVLDFGASMSEIKGKEERPLEKQQEIGLVYEGLSNDIRNVVYIFENGGMSGVLVLIRDSESVIDEATVFLEERYDFGGYTDGYFIFSNEKFSMVLTYDLDLGYTILYIEGSFSGRISIQKMLKNMGGEI